MDYDIVRNSISTAYKNYGENDKKFYSSMDKFYTEGSKNPAVAKIMLNDYIFNRQRDASKMLEEVAMFPSPDISTYLSPESQILQRSLYNTSVNAAQKSISAQQLYKNSSVLEGSDSRTNYGGVKSHKNFDQAWNKLYPKTGKIRERIINSNRINMANVTRKADWSEKIIYAKSLSEYKKDYPKTFFARYYLIMNNQIEEGQVNSRVKNWFKRFVYKRLIKNGFSFKK